MVYPTTVITRFQELHVVEEIQLSADIDWFVNEGHCQTPWNLSNVVSKFEGILTCAPIKQRETGSQKCRETVDSLVNG